MTTTPERERDQLLADLETVVEETLTALRGEIPAEARVDQWDARDVAAHFLYWHEATAWGIASVTTGGPPWPVPSGPDPINAATLRLREKESVAEILDELGRSQQRLLHAARATSGKDLDLAAFSRPDGTTVSIRARLEGIARHWRTHLDALRTSTATGAHEP